MSVAETSTYRLRAGAPMPISGGEFVIHSFMAVTNDVISDSCATDLPDSSEFQGQGGNLARASYSRLPVAGGTSFKGKKVKKDVYVEEAG